MPDPIYYHSDMSSEKKAEFERWYSEKVVTNCNFIMQQEAYCESDIKPLKGGCPMFGDEFKQKAVANCVWMLVVKIEGIERIY